MHPSGQARANLDIFSNSVADEIIRLTTLELSKTTRGKGNKGKQQASHPEENAEELAEFVQYISSDCFESFPLPFQNLSFSSIKQDPSVGERFSCPLPTAAVEDLLCNIPPAVIDSLTTYSIIPDDDDLAKFFGPILNTYVRDASKPPLTYDLSARSSFCEICQRDWIPLTYHHLIPRQVHAKVLKRGWHEDWQLDKVAWLCRQCHSFVHRIANNEELAREWWSVELLMQREDVQAFAKWIGRARWKPK